MSSLSAEQFSRWGKQLKASDAQAFSEMFELTYDALLGYTRRFIHCPDTSKDILQEVYVKLWDIRHQIDPGKSLKAFLYQMIRNRSLNFIRDTKDKNISLDSVAEPETDIYNTVDEPEIDTGPDSLESKMQEWIGELPERRREAFELSRFEGMSHEEIAQVMDLKPRTVNNHIVLAMQQLRSRLDEYRAKQKVI